MRTIKFRGKDQADIWHFGDLLHGENAIFIDDTYSEILGLISPTKVLTKTVGQFTGLLDKNDEEIYEGDIVEVLDTRMAVTYVNSSFRLRECTLACYDTKSIEVIGNIHENPELLEQEVYL